MSLDAGPLGRFTTVSEAVSARVIAAYSTSFGLATRLLGRRHRAHIRNIYALVRVADEIVDGVAAEAGLDTEGQRRVLEAYCDQAHEAMRTGYSSDLVVHAFARTARSAGIDETLTAPFFGSMMADLAPEPMDERAHSEYVHGSAEVIGLMCLRVFIREESVTPAQAQRLEHGARQLGAAFQNVNFLRDLADDTDRLGRSYLHSGQGDRLTRAEKERWVATIRAELDDARLALPLLPRDARSAVRAALMLFEALLARVEAASVDDLYRRRIRVPDSAKALLTARAIGTTWKDRQ